MEWDFTLSGEVLSFVSWSRGATDKIGTKASSGAVTLLPAFQGQFNISPNDRATLIIYNTTAADGEKITCRVVTDRNIWDDAILVVIKGECSFCWFTLYNACVCVCLIQLHFETFCLFHKKMCIMVHVNSVQCISGGVRKKIKSCDCLGNCGGLHNS